MSGLQSAPQIDSETSSCLAQADVSLDIETELDEIIKELENGGDMDGAQVKEYNMKLKQTIKAKLNDIEVKIEYKLQIKETDSRERKLAKAKATKGILSFLKKIFNWVLEALGWVLQKVYEGVKWCFNQVTSAFRGAISFLFG